MIRLHVTAADIGRVRFAVSPMWETITSLRTLTAPVGGLQVHRPWRDWVRGRLGGVDLFLLTALVRPAGYIPDFLVPSPALRSSSFAMALRQLAAADPAAVSWQLRHLGTHPVRTGRPRSSRTGRACRHC